jgi:hypothetical protein
MCAVLYYLRSVLRTGETVHEVFLLDDMAHVLVTYQKRFWVS